MLRSRGGDTAIAILPDGERILNSRCTEIFTHVVASNHVRVGWGWFRWCKSREEAEACIQIEVPESEAARGFTEVRIIECQMVAPWEVEDAPKKLSTAGHSRSETSRSKAKDLLPFASGWSGNDLEECLRTVIENRSESEF